MAVTLLESFDWGKGGCPLLMLQRALVWVLGGMQGLPRGLPFVSLHTFCYAEAMTRKLRLYPDTSVFSALYDERAPERQRLTQEFWAKLPEYERLCSQLTLEELGRVGDPSLREQLLNLTAGFQVVGIGEAKHELARAYVAAGVVPCATSPMLCIWLLQCLAGRISW